MSRMKYILIILGIIILTGCSINKKVTTKGTKDFLKEVQSNYEFIDTSNIYIMSGPNTLFIEYQIGDEIEKNLVNKCFEVTQEWIMEEETLDDIEAHLNTKVAEINIVIKSKSTIDRWSANYYRPGPKGYQDSRYWTEDNIDGFMTWRHEVE